MKRRRDATHRTSENRRCDSTRPGDLGYSDDSPDSDNADPDADSAMNPPPPDE